LGRVLGAFFPAVLAIFGSLVLLIEPCVQRRAAPGDDASALEQPEVLRRSMRLQLPSDALWKQARKSDDVEV